MLQHLTYCFLLKGIFFENEWVFLLIGTITNFKPIQQQSLSRRYWHRKIFVAKGGCDIFKGVWHRNIYHSGLIFRCACLPSLAGWSDWQGRLHLAFAHWIPRLKACNIKENGCPDFQITLKGWNKQKTGNFIHPINPEKGAKAPEIDGWDHFDPDLG